MKLKPQFIQIMISVVMILIAANQIIWIYNMYSLHKSELTELANHTTQKVVIMELSERTEIQGGYSVYAGNLHIPSDSSSFYIKKVTTADSIYTFTIDKNRAHPNECIIQFLLKEYLPINLEVLDSLFRKEIADKYDIGNTWFDYIDVESDTIIATNKSKKPTANFLSTDTIPLDILNSIAVVGHIEVPNKIILNKMLFQLILSIILIILSTSSMLFLAKSFVIQWRLEKFRQTSVNAMTHEFKRPISGALAMVSLIPFYLKNKNWSKVEEYATDTLTELQKLTAYTERIQQISNNNAASIALNKTEVEIESFFNSFINRYSDKTNHNKTIELHLEITSKQKYLTVDKLHFSNVIDNLIENAIKYSNNKVEIYLKVSDNKDKLLISVEDNGMGISVTDQKYIFDKYYRSNRKEMKNTVGFGLGLTYVKSIIEAHGAKIELESKLNEGSIFRINFA